MLSHMASFDRNDSPEITSGSESITCLRVLSEGSLLSESLFKSTRLMLTSDEYTGVASVFPKLYPGETCESSMTPNPQPSLVILVLNLERANTKYFLTHAL